MVMSAPYFKAQCSEPLRMSPSMTAIDNGDERRLLSHVCPPDWRNPRPAPLYDLVVLGGGTAGLVTAVGAAGLGARVALVERARLGGDCLNTGCVPSKALLRAARAVRDARASEAVGVHATVSVDFAAVMARVRAAREALAPHDSAARLTTLGVDVFFGAAAFSTPRTIDVGGTTLTFRRSVIATGSHPVIPAISGLSPEMCLTTDTLFDLQRQPESLAIVGAGPVGCEMAQAFALLGTNVVLIESASRVLPQEDPDASAVVARALTRAGVTIITGSAVERVTRDTPRLQISVGNRTFATASTLIAAGRAPSVSALNLTAAGVGANERGVIVDDCLRTSNRRIFAAGDVCSPYRYTHAADAMARIVVQNALFPGRARASALLIPRCTYTMPEVAHVGADARAAGMQAITIPLDALDRAVVDAETDGFVRIVHKRGRVHGATIVAPHAGDLAGHFPAQWDPKLGIHVT